MPLRCTCTVLKLTVNKEELTSFVVFIWNISSTKIYPNVPLVYEYSFVIVSQTDKILDEESNRIETECVLLEEGKQTSSIPYKSEEGTCRQIY